jgi:hypothetical protein
MEAWNVKTFVDIKQAIATGKTVSIILHENIASYGRVTSENAHKVTQVRTCRNPNEVEVELDNRGTFIPIGENDLILIK